MRVVAIIEEIITEEEELVEIITIITTILIIKIVKNRGGMNITGLD